MKISLVLCTYNRCQSLGVALESIAASQMPANVLWEVLVVDNNSRDQTREVVERFRLEFPGRFRYLFEPQPGKSNALNLAIRETDAEVLAFTDDDLTVEPTWLQDLTRPLLEDRCAGTAGRILLGDFQPPPWLAISGSHNLGGSLVQFDLGDESLLMDRAPFGASMAFRKSVFGECGDFRTDLGRSGKSLIGNEDTEFGLRVISKGLPLMYVPSAIVHHPVPRERLTKKYFRSYWFSHGRALIRQGADRPSFWKAPGVYFAEFKQFVRWMNTDDRHWYRKKQGRFFFEVHALRVLGQIFECWNQSSQVSQHVDRPE
jgi:glycosyltransferase involved in cell wall biosynthesis